MKDEPAKKPRGRKRNETKGLPVSKDALRHRKHYAKKKAEREERE